MKRLFTALAMFLTLLTATAQEEIQFSASEPAATGLTQETRELLRSKVAQILNRNAAAAAGDYGLFTVVPELTVQDTKATEGLVRDITVLTGELVLTARNAADGTEFYAVTVPLKATSKEAVKDPQLLLVKSIKITEPVFVRFVRNARQNIAKHYAANCDQALERARTMEVAGDIDAAVSMLYAIPANAPCAEEARALMLTLRERNKPETPDSVTVEVPVEVPVEVHDTVTVEVPVIVEKPVPAPAPAPVAAAQPEIRLSKDGWKVEVLNCTYNGVTKYISLNLKLEALNGNHDNVYTHTEKAISADGDTYNQFTYGTYDFPEGVPVKVHLDIKNVKQNPGKLAITGIGLGNPAYLDIEIRNLTVK